MPVNIHAGTEKGVDLIHAHFRTQPVKELLDQDQIESAGKTGPGGNGERDRSRVHADPAGAVRTARGRKPEPYQTFRKTAKR